MELKTIQISLNRARLLLEEGKNEDARVVLEAIQVDNEEQQRDVTYLLGWYYVLNKQWHDASQILIPLLNPIHAENQNIQQETLVERERFAIYLLRLGQTAVGLAHYEDASRHFLYCLKMLHDRRIQLPALRIEAQYNLAMTYMMRGSYTVAVRNYEDALRLCNHHQLYEEIPNIQYGLSETYRCLGDFAKAHEAAHEALRLYQENGNEPLQSRMYNVLGRISLKLGNYDASEMYYAKSLSLAISNNRPEMLLLDCAALAELFLEKADVDTAKEYAKRAIDAIEQVEDAFLRGVVYNAIGKVTLAEARLAAQPQNLFDEGIAWLQKSVDQFQLTQAYVHLVEVYSRLAEVSEELGYAKEAVAYWKLAYMERENANLYRVPAFDALCYVKIDRTFQYSI